jgi:AcrR family transcriptional regulator
MPAARSAKGVRAAQKEARPGEIVAAALEVFARDGFAGTRLEEVARRVGISKGTIYLYFDTKEDLFKACVSETIGRHVAETSEMAAQFSGSTADLVEEIVNRLASRLSQPQYRTILILMISEGPRFPELVEFYYEEVLLPGLTALKGVLDRGIARGELREPAVTSYPMLLMSPVIMTVIWNHLFGSRTEIALKELLKAHFDAFLNGIKT